jgi:hypothetical protein
VSVAVAVPDLFVQLKLDNYVEHDDHLHLKIHQIFRSVNFIATFCAHLLDCLCCVKAFLNDQVKWRKFAFLI